MTIHIDYWNICKTESYLQKLLVGLSKWGSKSKPIPAYHISILVEILYVQVKSLHYEMYFGEYKSYSHFKMMKMAVVEFEYE